MGSSVPSIRTLRLNELTHESWSPFGTLPSDEQTPNDTSDLEFLQHDGHVNFIAHTNSELSFTARGGACCELLNRHDTHTQTLMPMTCDAYVVVAPRSLDFSRADHFNQVLAFRLPQYVAAHLHRGTWHWGPYPIGATMLRIFNVQGRGYANDNTIAWLARDHSITYEVLIHD